MRQVYKCSTRWHIAGITRVPEAWWKEKLQYGWGWTWSRNSWAKHLHGGVAFQPCWKGLLIFTGRRWACSRQWEWCRERRTLGMAFTMIRNPNLAREETSVANWNLDGNWPQRWWNYAAHAYSPLDAQSVTAFSHIFILKENKKLSRLQMMGFYLALRGLLWKWQQLFTWFPWLPRVHQNDLPIVLCTSPHSSQLSLIVCHSHFVCTYLVMGISEIWNSKLFQLQNVTSLRSVALIISLRAVAQFTKQQSLLDF